MTLIKKNMIVNLYEGPNKVINPIYVAPREMIAYLKYDKRYKNIPIEDKKLIIDIANAQIEKGKHDACFIVHITHSDIQECTYIQYKGIIKYTD